MSADLILMSVVLLAVCAVLFRMSNIYMQDYYRRWSRRVDEGQRALSIKVLTALIRRHEEKRLVCERLIVGSVYKAVLEFDQEENWCGDEHDRKLNGFLGSFYKIPVFYSPVLYDGGAIALSPTLGHPMTSTEELGEF